MSEKTLRYLEEAKAWVEALPLGNGRIGAMVYGGVINDRVSINEDTFWSGYPKNKNAKNGKDYLPEIRELVLKGELKKAQHLAEDTLEGGFTESYLPFCDLVLEHLGIDQPVTGYERSLELNSGVAKTKFVSNGVTYTRETFVSHPGQALVMRLTADQPGKISLKARLESEVQNKVNKEGEALVMDLQAPGVCLPVYVRDDNPIRYFEEDAKKGMRARGVLQAQASGGSVQTANGQIVVEQADSVVLLFCARTSYNGFNKHPYLEGRDEKELVSKDLANIKSKSWEGLKAAHTRDFSALFDRVDFHLDLPREEGLDTYQRLVKAKEGKKDPALYELIFHYGRYLMIASSRPGTQATTLQGIWNREMRPPWSSNYTVNINTEMNYWLSEPCNLSELSGPLFDLIEKLRVTGKQTAQETYGANGVVCHHNTDIWGMTNAVGDKQRDTGVYALWPMAYAWLIRQMMEHYDYTQDVTFLKEKALPAISDAAEFLLDTLTENGDGRLAFSPMTSPENTFRYEGDELAVCGGATMTIAITREVFFNLLRCGDILGEKSELMDRVKNTLPKLAPYQKGKHGQLLEWEREYEEVDPHHRHFSHLYPLHPGREFDVEKTPEWAEAVKRSLELRGDEGTGWSLGWKISQWARLRDGDRALKLLSRQLNLVPSDAENQMGGGGTYLNLFGAHPPFQIDGNFAASAGIAEMLVQNTGGDILLLPALPAAWAKGFVRGLRAFGGCEVDIVFEGAKLKEAKVKNTLDKEKELSVRYDNKRAALRLKPGETLTLKPESF